MARLHKKATIRLADELGVERNGRETKTQLDAKIAEHRLKVADENDNEDEQENGN